ncbi:hypothetical protein DPMN_052968 [Dreissena polymorpha]|uniref:Uncharacterized protein n=1 Tax=Dreissena polymorpha TaxID=45954 RepID=A0A9D4CME0_DREPO|nr:hypothetical protein DPMN_052968 [Dreissena polymorpha]
MANKYWKTSVSLLTAKIPNTQVRPSTGRRIHILRTPVLYLYTYVKIEVDTWIAVLQRVLKD